MGDESANGLRVYEGRLQAVEEAIYCEPGGLTYRYPITAEVLMPREAAGLLVGRMRSQDTAQIFLGGEDWRSGQRERLERLLDGFDRGFAPNADERHAVRALVEGLREWLREMGHEG